MSRFSVSYPGAAGPGAILCEPRCVAPRWQLRLGNEFRGRSREHFERVLVTPSATTRPPDATVASA